MQRGTRVPLHTTFLALQEFAAATALEQAHDRGWNRTAVAQRAFRLALPKTCVPGDFVGEEIRKRAPQTHGINLRTASKKLLLWHCARLAVDHNFSGLLGGARHLFFVHVHWRPDRERVLEIAGGQADLLMRYVEELFFAAATIRREVYSAIRAQGSLFVRAGIEHLSRAGYHRLSAATTIHRGRAGLQTPRRRMGNSRDSRD
ncbi:hypothetical protein DFH06DRAFT_1140694 [Mycena polygramma]|nr:hypothetical protein DFH06DRAFT_1140694 [Mycena polygramma]